MKMLMCVCVGVLFGITNMSDILGFSPNPQDKDQHKTIHTYLRVFLYIYIYRRVLCTYIYIYECMNV